MTGTQAGGRSALECRPSKPAAKKNIVTKGLREGETKGGLDLAKKRERYAFSANETVKRSTADNS